ncbi:UvrD-helicase domain-containing protein [Bacteroidales bacterium OttesenSCG-928-J19]|nr:UvrD-helicase domain-containing protein [Bacteroidales bacterium OttesenSCG-928-J19]
MSTSQLKIYKASAGSGKTYTLALEYIKQLLMSPSAYSHRHILAVTFTKDATGEMKDRILAELYGLAFSTDDSQGFLNSLQRLLAENNYPMREEDIRRKAGELLRQILSDYSRLNITTIDSFFQRVLRNLARELGTGSRFNLEMNVKKVLSEAVHSMIENAKPNTATLEWLTTYIENKLDEGKSWNIEDEILSFSQCIYNEFFQEHEDKLKQQLKENPRIFADLQKQQKEIQAKAIRTFEEAWGTVNQILERNGLELSEFGNSKHAINFFYKLGGGDYSAAPGTYVLRGQADPSFWGKAKSKRKTEIESLASEYFIPLLDQVIQIQNEYLTSRIITRNLHQLGLVWDISKEISRANKENNRFMLSDTALFLNQMMDGSDAPFIYEKIGAEVRHVMIDEFQDTSRLQWNNFKVLLSEILSRGDFSLIVGDVKQSIYRWRNGDWRILNAIEQELNADLRNLGFNYRSEKEVIDFNNRFFTRSATLLDGLYRAQFPETSDSPFLSAYKEENVVQTSPKKESHGFVSIDFLPKESEEGLLYGDLMKEAVVDKLQALCREGVPPREICILTRKNSHIVELGDYLASLHDDYPELAAGHYLSLISNEAFRLSSSLAVKILIGGMEYIADPNNQVARTQLEFYLSLLDGGRTVDIDRLSTDRVSLLKMPVFELLSFLYRFFDLDRVEGQASYLFTLFDEVTRFAGDGSTDLYSFLTFWKDELHSKAIPTGEAPQGVQAMTIHKSKGLQFHTVILPYCDWKLNPAIPPIVWCERKPGHYDLELLPVSYSKGMNDTIFADEYREETVQSWMDNLNVLYVALTRAEVNLLLLAQDNPKLNTPATVSDLFLSLVPELDGEWDEETRTFSRGILLAPTPKEEATTGNANVNPLKERPPVEPVRFHSYEFGEGESIFKQSNQSYEFLHPDRPTKAQYVAHGNLMHKLFERINTLADVERAVDEQIIEGNISPTERADYLSRIREAIAKSGVEDWFSGQQANYQECTILTEENGEVIQKRPDRVLISPNETLVIDFKFGEPRPYYKTQVKQYMELLRAMNYPNVRGFLWYVKEHQVEQV